MSTELLQQVAERVSMECFVRQYIREDNREQREEDGLGIRISQWAEWDGAKIMRVAASALEDSNFHKECALLLELAVMDWEERDRFFEKLSA